jgi:lactate dehydrogenase-like 2-hydroxyacid dehydrogenase
MARPRLLITSHIGSATEDTRTAMGAVALNALDLWLNSCRVPGNRLNPHTAELALKGKQA